MRAVRRRATALFPSSPLRWLYPRERSVWLHGEREWTSALGPAVRLTLNPFLVMLTCDRRSSDSWTRAIHDVLPGPLMGQVFFAQKARTYLVTVAGVGLAATLSLWETVSTRVDQVRYLALTSNSANGGSTTCRFCSINIEQCARAWITLEAIAIFPVCHITSTTEPESYAHMLIYVRTAHRDYWQAHRGEISTSKFSWVRKGASTSNGIWIFSEQIGLYKYLINSIYRHSCL